MSVEEEFQAIPKNRMGRPTLNLEKLPQKSKQVYEKTYNDFIDWTTQKNINEYTEEVILAYFTEKAQLNKYSSLVTMYSKLKTTLKIKKNVDITSYKRVMLFLRKQNRGYEARKSKTLNQEQINHFLKFAPNEQFLTAKIALIIGIAGACRTTELTNLTVSDVQEIGDSLLVQVKDTKTYDTRLFKIDPSEYQVIDYVGLIKMYKRMRNPETPHSRFFVSVRNRKCTLQPIGKNIIRDYPRKIATFLNLPDLSEYTGGCFRGSAEPMFREGSQFMTILRTQDDGRKSDAEHNNENTTETNNSVMENVSVNYDNERRLSQSTIEKIASFVRFNDCENCNVCVNVK